MSPLELKLKREFNKQQQELENYWVSRLSEIHDYVDDECSNRYFSFKKVVDAIVKESQVTELNKLLDQFEVEFEKCVYLSKWSNDEKEDLSEFQHDVLNFAMNEEIKNKLNEMQTIRDIAYYSNLQKNGHIYDLNIKQTLKRILYILNSITTEIIPPYLKEINNELNKVQTFMNEYINNLLKNKNTLDDTSKNETKKIFDYKKMNKLLELQGFKEVRQTGDHKIYNNGSKSIPVPQHNLGKGLSCKIQKQI